MFMKKDLREGDILTYKSGRKRIIKDSCVCFLAGNYATDINYHNPDLSDPFGNGCNVVLVERDGRPLQTVHSPVITKEELQRGDLLKSRNSNHLYKYDGQQRIVNYIGSCSELKLRTNEFVGNKNHIDRIGWDITYIKRGEQILFTSANEIRLAKGQLKLVDGEYVAI